MNKIEELIEQLCPEGVEFKELGEVCDFLNGKGHEKHIIENGKYIVVNSKFVSTDGNVKKYSDIQISPIYKDDILMVMSDLPNGKALAKCFFVNKDDTYTLNQRICALIVKDKSVNNAKFLYYLLNRNYQLLKYDSGSDQTNLKKDDILKITIPFPPIQVQQEIVYILDSFIKLEAELEAELEARRAQYNYYRNQLLSFEGKEVEWKTLGEVGELVRGNGMPKSDFTENGVGCIHYGQIYTYYGIYTNKTKSFVSPETAKKLQKVQTNDLIITNTSENLEDVCKTVVWLGENEIVTGGHATIFKHKENPKYLAYYTQTSMFFSEKIKYARGAKVIDIKASDLAKIMIPIPPLSEQKCIVGILDKFDSLVNDISVGIPAEIKARRKQYEYYRGKLLDFKPLIINH